jgi:hypothetical protein
MRPGHFVYGMGRCRRQMAKQNRRRGFESPHLTITISPRPRQRPRNATPSSLELHHVLYGLIPLNSSPSTTLRSR